MYRSLQPMCIVVLYLARRWKSWSRKTCGFISRRSK